MISINIDVVEDFEKYVLNEIDYYKNLGFEFTSYNDWENNEKKKFPDFDQKTAEEKQSLYNKNLIFEYSNLQERLIQPIPRTIKYSSKFIRKPEYEQGLQLIERKIRNGEDLTAHLSRTILKANSADGLLFDFGISHLHLGIKPDKKYPLLIQGGKDILFVIFHDDTAFFICIGNHRMWVKEELLEIVQKEFPIAIEKWEINVTSLNNHATEEQRLLFRGKGINTPVEINGHYYMTPGGGMNTAGTSMWGVFKMDKRYHYYETIDRMIKQIFEENKEEIEKQFNITGEINFSMTSINPLEFEDKKRKLKLIPEIKKEDLTGFTIKPLP